MVSFRITRRRSGLVAVFALASLLAFVVTGVTVSAVSARQLAATEEQAAQRHAVFVTNSILRYALTPQDLQAPVTGSRYAQLRAFVRTRLMSDQPVVRVKVWSPEGTVLFSDEPRLVGMSFEGDPDPEAASGQAPVSEVTDLSEPENLYERSLAQKLFATYVPLYLPGHAERGRPDAVAELY